MTTVYAFLENCHLLSRIDQYFDLSSVFSILHVHEVYTTPQALQRWLYCREHLKYVWNFYCVVTNHMRDLHTTETTGHERFPSGHNKLFSFCYNIQFFFTSKQLLYFLLICFTVCAIIAKNIGLSDFEINYKADVPGETHATVDWSDRNPPITAR